ncbi:ribonuclease P protein component [Synechococcus sp. R6-10]|jgi:ribonuclease P protein component|uniref:Ribonuclease P protein component n=1 Tax=Synechococcus sp. (strain JA-2-3B'a(2-13)) TaxID=321332 RepID=RNPA_SYNJB|nr:ribonuclease P protein component [Synechococcus sp. JA-2-3B'a(2-13)]Q2JHS3.1 RecName: Full=Ribonuclease P protein component; Short=RNase P protein; Short=RNaseP protein; AltName: Full=Protein C5 [Synechococcus sp. JA-2-3B'a(2-13)]ABD03860.1 ribonuclease P [Synechococcus sp. JA-2-3B'a(2-13)]
MLPAPHRLRDRRAFQALYQGGQRRSGAGLTLLFQPMPAGCEGIPSQVGLVIGRKVSKSAVKRNRLRRQLREILRPLCPNLKPGYRLLFISKANLLTYRWPELRAEVHRLLQKADLLVSTDVDSTGADSDAKPS